MTTLGARADRFRRAIGHHRGLNAFLSVTGEVGDGPFVAVKDVIDVGGTVTTSGSRPQRQVATTDAAVIARLRDAGCSVIGKTNLEEFAFGAVGNNWYYGPTRHPTDANRVPGGSSSGSAVAVAAGLCDWAIGTDTGGSIRIPAALCGVVGLKPSIGQIETTGVRPLAATLDVVGPIGRCVADVAVAFAQMRSTSVPDLGSTDASVRIAIPAGWVDQLDAPTAAAWNAVSAGLPEISFPILEQIQTVVLTIFLYEAARSIGGGYGTRTDAVAAEPARMLAIGRATSASEYESALAERNAIRAHVARAMNGWDAIITPTTACVAPLRGAIGVRPSLTRFTRAFNLTGQPAFSLPAPIPAGGLPVGIQVVGSVGDDERLCHVARVLEQRWATGQSRT